MQTQRPKQDLHRNVFLAIHRQNDSTAVIGLVSVAMQQLYPLPTHLRRSDDRLKSIDFYQI